MDDEGESIHVKVGTIIVATGYDNFDPEPLGLYGYGRYDDVITAMEFERLINASGPTGGKVVRPSDCKYPKHITFIQCVGSRDLGINPYCSSYCCMYALKNAQLIREKYPDAHVCILYMDIRSPYRGYEEFYRRARELGITFIRGKPGDVEKNEKGNLVVRVEDTLRGKMLNLETELLVLSIGAVPSRGTKEMSSALKIPLAPDGFFAEVHPKLKPVDTTVDGIFICGVAQGPKEIPYSISQASAAAARAARFLISGKAKTEAITSFVSSDFCIRCGICIDTCPYQAIRMVDGKIEIMEALCKGCGTCVASCNSGALEQRHFLFSQASEQIKNVFGYV
jgi:heterodisulfide reductase subunit A